MEGGRAVRRTILGDPPGADGELVVAEHVVMPGACDCRREEIRPLGHGRSDEQPAVRVPADGELPGGGVPSGDQVLRRGDEVVEAILLSLETARAVPFLAVLTAPP